MGEVSNEGDAKRGAPEKQRATGRRSDEERRREWHAHARVEGVEGGRSAKLVLERAA